MVVVEDGDPLEIQQARRLLRAAPGVVALHDADENVWTALVSVREAR